MAPSSTLIIRHMANNSLFIEGNEQGTFSGVDIKATLTIPVFAQSPGAPTLPSLIDLSNISTVSWSTHRDKVPVRRIGRSYAQAYTHGPRTIAGSLVFINFNKAALWGIISNIIVQTEESPVHSIMTDQLPPFDMHFLCVNEDGLSAFMSIMGIEIVDEGMVLGTDEAYIETTMQYVARDIDLLNPGPNLRETWDNVGSEEITETKSFSTEIEAQQFVDSVGNGTIQKFIDTGSGEKPWLVTYKITLSKAYMGGLASEENKRRFVRMLNSQGFDQLNNFAQMRQPVVYYDSVGNPHLDRAAIHDQWLSVDPTNPDLNTQAELKITAEEEAAILADAGGNDGFTAGSTVTTDDPDLIPGEIEPQSSTNEVFDITLTLTVYSRQHINAPNGPVLEGVTVLITDHTGNEYQLRTNSSGVVTVTAQPCTEGKRWKFVLSKTGYQTNSYTQTINQTSSKSAFVLVDDS